MVNEYYDWTTYGEYLAGKDPVVVSKCAHCGQEITVNDHYWIVPCPLTADDYVCEDCLEDYIIDQWGAQYV